MCFPAYVSSDEWIHSGQYQTQSQRHSHDRSGAEVADGRKVTQAMRVPRPASPSSISLLALKPLHSANPAAISHNPHIEWATSRANAFSLRCMLDKLR